MSRFFPISFPVTKACAPDFEDLWETFKICEGCNWSIQAFLKSINGCGESFIWWWEPEAERFWPFEPFSKLKTTSITNHSKHQLKSKSAWPDKNLVGKVYWGRFFQVGGMSKFLAGWESPGREKPGIYVLIM